ncbi:ornithine carbamoyltransferase [Actinoplanes sp. KI2]|uniref:ornithine carbamoyltransferase n=1 Tax=Actinoplanes sp. KI2 TaxID=2983315 RepID=UPI0021D5FBDD|nr:ornithine carbamoyltransferase [Actinoplanes sp. KI2]MCU7728891.1 ornithine carbamoyltransferase [Actinoplanes sp. KI2]
MGHSAAAAPRRHVISLNDLDDAALRLIVERGAAHARGEVAAGSLDGLVIGTYFRKTSTRTRTAFTAAALRLGARTIAYGPDDLQLNTGETMADTGRVLARMLDGLVARTAGPIAEFEALAAQDRMAVVNAMSAAEHPTQALADLTTLALHFGDLSGLRVLYLGEGNNTAAALALALPRFAGTTLDLRTPAGYGLSPEVLERAEKYAAGADAIVTERHDMLDLPPADVVYTTRWQTTGTTKNDPSWRDLFRPFQVDQSLMDACPTAVFLHDLPAHRGEEVTAAVLDGPRSIAFDQAENKMHSAAAVLEWCLGRL